MKSSKRWMILAVCLLITLPVFSQTAPDTEIEKFMGAIDSSAQLLGKALISNAAWGLNWSDAHIGQFIPMPPHFGAGLSLGFTAIPVDKFEPILNEFGASIKDMSLPVDFLPLPAAAGEVRIGGFFLPFDIGIKALPLPEFTIGEVSFKYTMFGGDIRYQVVKERGYLPNVSVGVGFTYTDFDLGATVGDQIDNMSLAQLGHFGGYDWTNASISIDRPNLDFAIQNTTIDFKVQASKRLLIFTPYAGLGVSYGWSTTKFGVNSTIRYNGPLAGELGAWVELIQQYFPGVTIPIKANEATGLEKEVKYDGFAFRAFGGFSINLFILKIDLTGMYDLANGNWGAGLGARIQI